MSTPGREDELALLRRAARAAAAGAGSAVLVQGPAGIGKSFLVDAAVRESALAVLRGRAWEEGGAPPYWPWREVAAAGGWSVESAGDSDPFAVCALMLGRLRAAAADRPVMVVLEDLHAADEESLRLARYVARSVSDAPVLLLAAARPSDRLDALEALRIDLPPLDDVAAGQVVDLWATRDLDDALRRRLLREAEGNPLHLRELARLAHRDSGRDDGLRATVLRRLADVGPAVRTTLDAAAVLGREFDLLDLGRLLDEDPGVLLRHVDAARAAGVVVPVAGPVWRFSHQVHRDVAYDALPGSRRAELHARAATAIDGAPARAGETARHLLDAVPAVPPDEAVAAARVAARRAVDAGAPADAAAVLRRALPYVPVGERLDTLLQVGELELDAGQVQAAHRSFDEAVELARRTGSTDGLVRGALGRTARMTTDLTAAEHLALLGEALARAEAGGRTAQVVRVRARRAVVLSGLDRWPAARSDAVAAVDVARRLGDPALLAEALNALHMTCWEGGYEDLAARTSQEMVAVSEQAGDDDRLLEALVARLVDALHSARLASVDEALAALVALADRTGRPRHRYFADSRRAMRAFLVGRLAEGDQLSERARVLGERIEEPDTVQVYTGSRLMVLGDLLPGEELADRAQDLEDTFRSVAPSLGWLVSVVWAAAGRPERARAALRDVPPDPTGPLAVAAPLELVLRAHVVAATGDREYAAVLLPLLRPHAGRVAVNAGAVTFCGAVDHYLGLLDACLGRPEAARRELLAARATYTGLGASLLLGRVDAALAALDAGPGPVAMTRTAVLRRSGDGWEVGSPGATTVLPDLRGLHHLWALLRVPGREVAAVELAAPGSAALVAAQARDVLLDGPAKRAYRARIARLRGELEGTEDEERQAALRTELDALLAELRRAVGLGGRDRPAASDAERARVAVRKAVTAALDRLAEHDTAVAHLLRSGVRTGASCVYEPDPNVPVRWLLDEVAAAGHSAG